MAESTPSGSGRSNRVSVPVSPNREVPGDGLVLRSGGDLDSSLQAPLECDDRVALRGAVPGLTAGLLAGWSASSPDERCSSIRDALGAITVGIASTDGTRVIQCPPEGAESVSPSLVEMLLQAVSNHSKSAGTAMRLLFDPGEFPAPSVLASTTGSDDEGTKTVFWAGFEDRAELAAAEEQVPFCHLLLEATLREEALAVEKEGLEAMVHQSQRLAGVGQLATGVAHDFNNLLTVIRGNVELIRPEISCSSCRKTTESLETIDVTTNRAVALTKQLLSFARDEQTTFARCDMNQVIRQFGRMMRRMIEENIDLEFDLASDCPDIQGDPGMLCQILMNLLVNARDAMPKGGKIIVRTERIPTSDGSEGELDGAKLVVEDTGTGIDPDHVSRIFDPFFTTKKKGKGTGLGLANVADIVRQHDGKVEVDSAPGEGTRFEISFPGLRAEKKPSVNGFSSERCASGPGGEAGSEHGQTQFELPTSSGNRRDSRGSGSRPRNRPLRGTHVLLVEDDRSVRRLVRKLLEMLGCEVTESHSGRDALDRWPEIAPGITMVLSDVMMPEGVSGWDLARALHESHPELAILLTSGYNERPEDHGLGDIPEIAFLQKPYDAKSLREGIGSLLREAS